MKEKKLKKKSIYKMFSLILTIAVTSTTFLFDSIVRAATDKEDFIKTSVTYNDEKTKANVEFEIDSIDKKKYEVTSIISDKEGTVIYDRANITEKNKPEVYETTVNGSYTFTIKYVEKKKEEVVENKSESLDISQNEIFNDKNIGENNTNKNILDNENSVIPEKKVIEVAIKEKIVNVIVDGIKEKNNNALTENSNGEMPNQKKAIDSNNETVQVKNVSQIQRNTFNTLSVIKNENIDLEEKFNLTGSIQYGNRGEIKPINTEYYRVSKNEIFLGKKDCNGWTRQTINLTSKYSVDFKRNFKISGRLNLTSNPEGFAIGFHNDKDYISKNTGGSMGIYHSDYEGNTSLNDGLNKAVVVEVDNYENSHFGDDGSEKRSHHLGINTTDDKGNANKVSIKKITNNYFNKLVDFELDWIGNENKIKFNLAGNIIESTLDNDITNKLKETEGYYTIATGINYDYGSGNNKIIIDGFKYTDIQSQITTTISTLKKDYAIPKEKVTVTHEIKNEKSTIELYDVLNLGKMKIDNAGNNLTISNIKVGESLDELRPYTDKNGIFDDNTPMLVKYPVNRGSYYVQYEVEIPDLKNYGSTNNLDYEVLLGQKGMTQISSNGSLEVRNKPSLVTKKDGQIKELFDVFNVSRVEDVNSDTFWQEFYVKTATGDETKLLTENNNASDLKIKWHYCVDLHSYGNSLPINVEKNKIYSMYLQVSDENDSRLTNTFKRYIVIADYISTDSDYYVYGSDSKAISETKLVTLSEKEFKEYVKDNTKPGALKHIKNGDMEIKDVDVDTIDWLDSNDTPYKLPGEQPINLFVSEQPVVKLQVNQEVTENTWNYDTKDRTEENGASGFIVIPKSINMGSGSGKDKDKLVAEGNIFFANYDAKDVRYKLYVDKEFKLTKTDDVSNQINVISSFLGAEDKGNNRLFIDTMHLGYHKGNPLTINFKALRSKENKIKGKWNGNVTFYFERVN